MTHEAAIRDLESEKSRLKDKVLRLEEERGALQNKSQALDERQRQQILTLEKVLSYTASERKTNLLLFSVHEFTVPCLKEKQQTKSYPFHCFTSYRKSAADISHQISSKSTGNRTRAAPLLFEKLFHFLTFIVMTKFLQLAKKELRKSSYTTDELLSDIN